MRRGITMVELLLSITIIAIVTLASSRAFVLSLSYGDRVARERDNIAARESFESQMRQLFQHAYISPTTTDLTTYFIGGVANNAASSNGQTALQTTASNNNSVTFTTVGQRVSGAVIASTDDFTTNNQRFGPVGGVSEISLNTTAVGDNASGKQGLFLRKQTPSDTDPTQGGFESVLSEQLSEISYEYYDGTEWTQSWDTRTMTTRRLPAAVRITYRMQGDQQDNILIIAIPASDVTTTNPLVIGQ